MRGRIEAMIDQDQMMSLLLEAIPSFHPIWDEHRREYGNDLHYVAFGDFARHLLSLYNNGQTQVFPALLR